MPCVPHVVVFSELTPQARAQYTRFLLEQNVQFVKRPSDGKYIATVRLQLSESGKKGAAVDTLTLSPGIQHNGLLAKTDDDDEEYSNSNDDHEGFSTTLSEDDSVKDGRFDPFMTFIHMVGGKMLQRTSMGTYVRSEKKLVRLINDIYDARAMDLQLSDSTSLDGQWSTDFAVFVHFYLKGRFGIRALVEQQALELLEGLMAHKDRVDVEHFTLFLTGQYATTRLGFFLKARDAVQEAISTSTALFRPTSAASARRRRSDTNSSERRQRRASSYTAALVCLSKPQIENAAQKAFDSKKDDSYLQFAHRVRSFLASRKVERPTQALLETQEFLSLALQTFVDLEQASRTHRSVSLSSASGHEAHDGQDTMATSSSPSPSPLPPPPVPSTCGSIVRRSVVAPKQHEAVATFETSSASSTKNTAPMHPLPSAERAAVSGEDDVQARLSSLMARMQQRRTLT